ncbi:pilus assembly protein [Pseudoduganella sp.]|uniref:pilus assembly protein n=1 Tax=Pseudoduganella sp. TaxID=1880898 RepID=UPI0035B16949
MRLFTYHLPAAVLCGAGLLLSAVTQAGDTDLADKPLANSTTSMVLPNIMLDLDNSGSMRWDYMPDYVRMRSDNTFEYYCRDTSGTFKAVCEQGDPLYFASAFNKAYYNPAVRYQWPVNADGTPKADGQGNTSYKLATTWGAVPSDGYNVQVIDNLVTQTAAASKEPCNGACPSTQPSTTIDLANKYPERKWCNSDWSPKCSSAVVQGEYRYPDSSYATLQVVYGAPYYYNVKIEWCDGTGSAKKCQPRRTSTYKYLVHSNWQRVDIKSGGTFPKSTSRTDCTANADYCTYGEEMSNFATWYAWYRTRAQMAKSSIGHAFVEVRGTPKTGAALKADPDDASFFHARIGLTTINKNKSTNIPNINLAIDAFQGKQKESFYSELYKSLPSGGTPLRESLNEVGKMYAGTSEVYADPIQFSCQRNFAILATDGYWNGNDSGDTVKDLDGVKGVARPFYAPTKQGAKEKTLADVAYHYYVTDLRTSGKVSQNNVPSGGGDERYDDVATHQHMTTFTLGLGVDGTLGYTPDYKTAPGAYEDIAQGTLNWPWPEANEQTTIDDLWHAAVNGRGVYFSAQDPVALEEGMRKALGSIEQVDGSGAAAATSNLQPVSGDNYIYLANYRTGLWDGELSRRSINLSDGEVSAKDDWQASAMLAKQINADGSDTRNIWTSDANKALVPFKVVSSGSGLSPAQQAFFVNSKLSQFSEWTAEQKAAANAKTMVNFLRGHDPKVGTSANARLYRERVKILGDFVHSQPVYVQMAQHDFSDDGYADFKNSTEGRAGTIYAAANDGMLHAFDATTGAERWAYIPPMLLPELWRLADENYADHHRYYLDGPLAVADADIGGWKTVLVGAMGKGGRGYYALDVTNPAQPKVLWTFTAENEPNLGFSYGTPYITKLDGKWVVLLTSGYNNVPKQGGFNGGDGGGYVFVLNLADGSKYGNPIATGAGSVDDPSGLARINIVVEDFAHDDTALAAYGGDLHGNLWRFDLKNRSASQLLKLGSGMPITTTPEVVTIGTKRSVFVATGRFLGTDDLAPPAKKQVIIGVRDNGSGVVEFPGTLIKQSLTPVSEGGVVKTRTNASKQKVSWATDGGWYVELDDAGERVSVDPQLFFGTLLVSSVVPTASDCESGGYSWMYQLDYNTGGFVIENTPVGIRQSAPIVGMTVSKLPSGTPVIHGVTADGQRPRVSKFNLPPNGVGVPVKRLLWRGLGN